MQIQEQSGIQYGSFVDSSKQVWSMKFDSPETAESFTIHVAIATGQALRDLFIYDLVEGKSEVCSLSPSCLRYLLSFRPMSYVSAAGRRRRHCRV